MTKAQRDELAKARGMIEQAQSIIDRAATETREHFDGMSEKRQASERGLIDERAADELESACASCDDVLASIETALSDEA